MVTSDRQIESPVGARVGKIFEKLEVLGISSHLTQSLNQANGVNQYEETVNIDVPIGTLAVVPMPNLWMLGHGRLRPDRIDPLDENQQIQWDAADRPWALGKVHVSVVDINSPDFSQDPPRQTAQIIVYMRLIDKNGDDPWFGLVGYTLMFLGQAPADLREPAPATSGRLTRPVWEPPQKIR